MATDKTAPLKLPDKGIGSMSWWTDQLTWAAEITDLQLPEWRYHANAYRGAIKPPRPEGIRVNIEFEKTEQKKPQLLYRLPEIKLRAAPRTLRDAARTGQNLKKAIAIYREFLTRLVGPRGANLKASLDEVLFDVLCPAGIGGVKVGYERFDQGVIQIATGQMIPDPNYSQPGSVLGIAGAAAAAPMIPEMAPGPNVIAEKYYATRISPPNLIIHPEFRGSDYSQSVLLGHKFFTIKEEMKRRGWAVPDGLSESSPADAKDRIVELPKTGTRTGQIACTELFFYPQRLNGSHPHPDKIYRLILAAGAKEPVSYGAYKDQRFDDRGRLVGGLRSLPIKVLTLRYVSDYPFPPSDCQITRGQSDELSEFRTQQLVHRRKSVPMTGIDINRILNDKVKKQLTDGNREYCDVVPFDGPPGNSIAELARGSYPQENRVTADMIMGDVNRLWALGANAGSVAESGGTTATEIATIAQATANRLGGESVKVIALFIEVVEAFGALAQLYADHEDYVEILGEDGAKQVEAFTKAEFQGEYLYEAVPDTSRPPDAKADRDLMLNRHNLIANSPFINGKEDMRDLIEAFDGDPDRLVVDPQQPPTEKPKISLSFSATDLDPALPSYPNTVAVLASQGITVVPPAPAPLVPPAPGGPAEPVTPANVIDRERLRMSESDNRDARGGLQGA